MEFRLLGPMQALHEGRSVALGRRRERALLALLLLQTGSVVPIGRLAALLWDDTPPPSARASLHTHVSRLRAVLAPRGVQVRRESGGYRVDVAPDQVDAHAFRLLVARAQTWPDLDGRVLLLREGLGLWRGPLLADLGAGGFRERVGVELTELRLAASELLMATELERGRHHEIIAELTTLVAENPQHERFTAQLMIALYRCGRRAEALATYDRTHSRIAKELGLDPGPELRKLRLAILRDHPSLSVAAAAPPPRNALIPPQRTHGWTSARSIATP